MRLINLLIAHLKASIVILNWNGVRYLKQLLNNIVTYSSRSDVEIVVADNGSTDNSIEWVTTNFESVKVVALGKNYGFAEGYNRALANIDAEYYLLLNSDIEVTEGWLNSMITFMDSHPEVAAAQPKVRSFFQRDHFEHAGAAGGFIDKYGYPFCRGRILHITEVDTQQYDNEAWEIFWATGACSIIRSTAWKRCGGLDEHFFAHMEEIDLCWRFHRAGYKVAVVKDSLVYHVGGGTLPYSSPTKTYLNFRNGFYMLYKNLSDKDFRKTLFIRHILDIVAACFFLVKLQFKNFGAVIRARRDFRSHLPILKKQREEIKLLGDCSPTTEIVLQKSIVFDFYILQRKTYSAIVK